MAYMTCVTYTDFFIIFYFILFHLITSFLNHISWLLGIRKWAAIYLEGESTEF